LLTLFSIYFIFHFNEIHWISDIRTQNPVDGNNLGPSYIQALGDHTGGGLWTEDQGVVDARHKWKRFMGTKLHETQPFEGKSRISLIAFTHSAFEELEEELCGALRDLGFMAVGSSRIRGSAQAALAPLSVHNHCTNMTAQQPSITISLTPSPLYTSTSCDDAYFHERHIFMHVD
jgi:hypothetical protein